MSRLVCPRCGATGDDVRTTGRNPAATGTACDDCGKLGTVAEWSEPEPEDPL